MTCQKQKWGKQKIRIEGKTDWEVAKEPKRREAHKGSYLMREKKRDRQ